MKITITPGVRFIQGLVTISNAPVEGGGGPAPANNELWAWGSGNNGRLGLGNTTSYSSPVQIGALTDWASISSNGQTLAVKTDGSLWAWGWAYDGILGDGTIIDKSSPIQIGALTDWASVATGSLHSAALKTDGSLWAWGRNTGGYNMSIGDGTNINRSSPVQIGSLTDWASISVGSANGHAIKTDGTLWGWGVNVNNGAVGDGTTINRSSPVQIGSLTDWASVESTGNDQGFAVKTDGTLWAWGFNNQGVLADGTTINRSSPVQIGALTDWASLGGAAVHMLALKTDNSLWSWGRNDRGQEGHGDIIVRSSPVQVGALTDWAKLDNRSRQSHAIKTDGTLWAWGNNDSGELGFNDTNQRSSPVQVGSDTNWSVVAAASNATFALKTTT